MLTNRVARVPTLHRFKAIFRQARVGFAKIRIIVCELDDYLGRAAGSSRVFLGVAFVGGVTFSDLRNVRSMDSLRTVAELDAAAAVRSADDGGSRSGSG